MPENDIQVIITLSAPDLKEVQLLRAVQNFQQEVQGFEGVQEAGLIPVEEAPEGAMSLTGFLIDRFKAVVTSEKFQNFIRGIAGLLMSRQAIEIEAEGNGRKLKVKFNSPSDLAQVLPDVEKFING
jgi:hypothetical protein